MGSGSGVSSLWFGVRGLGFRGLGVAAEIA